MGTLAGVPQYRRGKLLSASEVCRALLGIAWEPYVAPHESSFHWFLKHRESDETLDPTAEQFRRLPSYEGRGQGDSASRPVPAQILLWRVMESFGAVERQESRGRPLWIRLKAVDSGLSQPMAGRP